MRIDFRELREVVLEFQVLLCALRPEPLLTLLRVLLPQRIDVDVFGRLGRPAGVEQCH
jgi:hypothetical protein